jgi:nicotinamidase-related amidase
VNANGDGYPTNRTALLLIDPYNDFLSEGGKFWPGVEEVGKEVRLLENLQAITTAGRNAGIQTFIIR